MLPNHSYYGEPVIKRVTQSKKVQIVSFPVPEMKARERSPASQKEPVFTPKEGVQKIFLKGGEFAICQLAPLSASDPKETPRIYDAVQDGGRARAIFARLLQAR